MTPHRLRRVALQRTRKRSQRDPQDFYHGLLAAGLSEDYASAFQSFGSSYVHSGSLSALQVRNATSRETQRDLLLGTLGVVVIACANMIEVFGHVFHGSTAFLEHDPQAAQIVATWVEVGSKRIADL